jgi:hypothetical protein
MEENISQGKQWLDREIQSLGNATFKEVQRKGEWWRNQGSWYEDKGNGNDKRDEVVHSFLL